MEGLLRVEFVGLVGADMLYRVSCLKVYVAVGFSTLVWYMKQVFQKA